MTLGSNRFPTKPCAKCLHKKGAHFFVYVPLPGGAQGFDISPCQEKDCTCNWYIEMTMEEKEAVKEKIRIDKIMAYFVK